MLRFQCFSPMHAVLLAAVLSLATGSGCARSVYQGAAPLFDEDSTDCIEGEYIVRLKDHLTDDEVSAHIDHMRTQALLEYAEKQEDIYAAAVESFEEQKDTNIQPDVILNTHFIEDIKGYSARLSDRLRDNIRHMKEVKYIKRNCIMRAGSCKVRPKAEWGLIRTTTRYPSPALDFYEWDSDAAGKGVVVYVLDSGIDIHHKDFNGRAKWYKEADFFKHSDEAEDLRGHGTAVAGIIMSETYGVANEATAISVRVGADECIRSYVVDGLKWAIQHHDSRTEAVKKSIINLSCSGPRSEIVNGLVKQATDKNIYVVSSAGHVDEVSSPNPDACSVSPASAPTSITVMASDEDDNLFYLSKLGKCAHIVAPGVNILSTSNSGGTAKETGNSLAVAHVSGIIAKHISSLSVLPTPVQLRDELVFNATKDVVKSLSNLLRGKRNNALVHYPCPLK